jgi:sigma-B regulation protein RsbQ
MIGVLAQKRAPERFAALALVSPSPRYIDDHDYRGGFAVDDIDDLITALSDNYLGWSAEMAPVIMGNTDRPELAAELSQSFCRADPAIAERFATVTFYGDNRADLPDVTVPTLVLQCRDDAIAPVAVGEYVADAIPDSSLVVLDATGHCPNLSAPRQVVQELRTFLTRLA